MQRRGFSIINKFEPLEIRTTDGKISNNGYLEEITTDEEILIYPYTFTTEEVYIFIQETEVPTGYKRLSKPITMVLELDKANKEWVNLQIKQEKMNYKKTLAAIAKQYKNGTPSIDFGIDITNDISKIDGIDCLNNIWSWVQKEEEYLGNNQYDNNLPNTYCIYDGQDSVLEQNVMETSEIKDVISAEIDNDEDKNAYIINVYNEPLTYKIPIDLIKLKAPKNGENPIEVPGAQFTISIKQKNGNEYVINETNKTITDLHYEIETPSTNDIYVVINEIQAPERCKKITQPINVIFKYINRKWVRSYTTTAEELQAVGFSQSDFGGWEAQEDENDELVTYISATNDVIKVGIDGSICVLNEELKSFNKVTLLKVNKNDYKLPGAVFSGSIANIKSFKKAGIEYIPQSGSTFTFQNWELTTGELSIDDVILENPNEDLVIQITEDRPPEHYLNFADYVRIKLSYKNRTGTVEYGLSDVEDDLPVIVAFDEEDSADPAATIKIVNTKSDATLQLSLLKLDKTTNLLLDGASFSGTISNIVSFKDAEGNLKTANNQRSVQF